MGFNYRNNMCGHPVGAGCDEYRAAHKVESL
jgi:hypothetical protein